MIDGNQKFRATFEAVVLPVGKRLAKLGLTPNMVTTIGVASSAAACIAIGTGHNWIGLALLTIGGISDGLDGAVASLLESESLTGKFFDSVADRVSDGLLLLGFAWLFLSNGSPETSLIPWGIFLGASLTSYQRAKAESLGLDAKGGLLERGERLVVLGVALVFVSWAVEILLVMLVLTALTALDRFVKILKQTRKIDKSAGPSGV